MIPAAITAIPVGEERNDVVVGFLVVSPAAAPAVSAVVSVAHHGVPLPCGCDPFAAGEPVDDGDPVVEKLPEYGRHEPLPAGFQMHADCALQSESLS